MFSLPHTRTQTVNREDHPRLQHIRPLLVLPPAYQVSFDDGCEFSNQTHSEHVNKKVSMNNSSCRIMWAGRAIQWLLRQRLNRAATDQVAALFWSILISHQCVWESRFAISKFTKKSLFCHVELNTDRFLSALIKNEALAVSILVRCLVICFIPFFGNIYRDCVY